MSIHDEIMMGCELAAERGTGMLKAVGIDNEMDQVELFMQVSHNTCDYDLSDYISQYIPPEHESRKDVWEAMKAGWAEDEWFHDFIDSMADYAKPLEEDEDFGEERQFTVAVCGEQDWERRVFARSKREAIRLAETEPDEGCDWDAIGGWTAIPGSYNVIEEG